MNEAKLSGYYRHYKGNEYEIIGIATHSETMEKLIVYKATDDPSKLWARPYDMFFDLVIVDGEEIPRFAKIEKAKRQI